MFAVHFWITGASNRSLELHRQLFEGASPCVLLPLSGGAPALSLAPPTMPKVQDSLIYAHRFKRHRGPRWEKAKIMCTFALPRLDLRFFSIRPLRVFNLFALD